MSFKDKILKNQSPWGAPPGGGSNNGNGSGTRPQPPSLDDIKFDHELKISKPAHSIKANPIHASQSDSNR